MENLKQFISFVIKYHSKLILTSTALNGMMFSNQLPSILYSLHFVIKFLLLLISKKLCFNNIRILKKKKTNREKTVSPYPIFVVCIVFDFINHYSPGKL